eukprot:3978519-Prymnesium_polylepis.1
MHTWFTTLLTSGGPGADERRPSPRTTVYAPRHGRRVRKTSTDLVPAFTCRRVAVALGNAEQHKQPEDDGQACQHKRVAALGDSASLDQLAVDALVLALAAVAHAAEPDARAVDEPCRPIFGVRAVSCHRVAGVELGVRFGGSEGHRRDRV